jgi:hypothetical protein
MDQEQEKRLDRLFAVYRTASPDFEPSANFLPDLWTRIESTGPVSWVFALKQFSIRLAAASALLAAILSGALWLSSKHDLDVRRTHYVDVLAEDSMSGEDAPLWLQAGNQR